MADPPAGLPTRLPTAGLPQRAVFEQIWEGAQEARDRAQRTCSAAAEQRHRAVSERARTPRARREAAG
ncbi:MAG: hypothetical protein JOY55_25440 [Mycobacterium sp.]|jgi:hypothetical protein|nr:hypothetical protein [Mycobacterium sp.]